MSRIASQPPDGEARGQGIAAMVVAVLVLSAGSTIIKWSGLAGPALALWRMVGSSLGWWLVILVRRVGFAQPLPSRSTWRTVLPAGLLIGLNISLFFSAINHTSVAHAEFINSLSPLLVVPVGMLLFGERPNVWAAPFGALSLVGLALVLLNGPDAANSSWRGDLVVVAAIVVWATYLAVGRRARMSVDVVDFMSTLMPIGVLAAAPWAFLQAGDELWPIGGRGWVAIVGLSISNGMLAHALIAIAQRRLDVGTISVITVGQPAIAVCWAMLLLSEPVAGAQVPGMILTVAGLVGFTAMRPRAAPAVPTPCRAVVGD